MFYTTIIGYKLLDPSYFRPKRQRFGADGKPVLGRYQKPYEDECELKDITKYPITAWRTAKDVMEGMPAEAKTVINKIKTFLSETPSAMWYHNGTCDGMAEFGIMSATCLFWFQRTHNRQNDA